jgi:hypothetical protein
MASSSAPTFHLKPDLKVNRVKENIYGVVSLRFHNEERRKSLASPEATRSGRPLGRLQGFGQSALNDGNWYFEIETTEFLSRYTDCHHGPPTVFISEPNKRTFYAS